LFVDMNSRDGSCGDRNRKRSARGRVVAGGKHSGNIGFIIMVDDNKAVFVELASHLQRNVHLLTDAGPNIHRFEFERSSIVESYILYFTVIMLNGADGLRIN